ncbi:MAG: hypothetical protein JWM10_4176 [Myxococcaceae bacterium]|nr:hypothetical protein [Myxococcaceae bacterium]
MHRRYNTAASTDARADADDQTFLPAGVVSSGGDQPAAARYSAPTRPYLRRQSGVLKTRLVAPGAPPREEAVTAPPPEPAPLRASLRPSPPRRTPVPRSSHDPWELGLASPPPIDEQLQTVSAALHLVLGRLSAQGPDDPALDEVRRAVAALHVRHAVREAREHEGRERWLHASRAWMRAAEAAGSDPWLFAHSARTLLLSNASSQDAFEVAVRALDLDPTNPIARTVLDRLRD